MSIPLINRQAALRFGGLFGRNRLVTGSKRLAVTGTGTAAVVARRANAKLEQSAKVENHLRETIEKLRALVGRKNAAIDKLKNQRDAEIEKRRQLQRGR